MTTISVTLRGQNDTCPVYIAPGLLPGIGGKLRAAFGGAQVAAVVTDDNVKARYLQAVSESLAQAGFCPLAFSVPPGEASKSAETYFALLNWLAENRLTRTDAVVALGGGVVGDVAGFAAATYLRGVPLAQVPTTLLAMVDSSVGGKTAIDLPSGKNLAGAFYQPSLVLCDPDVLATLPPEAFNDGCAEVVKYGMIRHDTLLERLIQLPVRQHLAEVIVDCVSIKRDVVQEDVFDVGERQLLNFGHTVGHAIEKLSGYGVSHGRAVAAGMGVMTRAAARKNLCPPECQTALEAALERFGLPNRTGYAPKALYEAALNDKKRAGGNITEVVPCAIGKCVLRNMPVGELLEWIELGLEP